MNLFQRFKKKARENPQRIVLPEGEDQRIIRAANMAIQEKIAFPILLGDHHKIEKKIYKLGLDLTNLEIINPVDFPKMPEYISFYCQMRKDHFVSKKVAHTVLKKSLNLGALMVKLGDADGMVAGADNLTASVLKSGILMIGLKEDVSIPSSFFIMATPDDSLGEKGSFVFADGAVNPDPTPSQLAEIAISSARSTKIVLGWEPRVALLSFSTKKSASHPLVDKVRRATQIVQEKAPHLLVDGDLQADAAIIPEVARKKVKESKVAGRANVLIFPDLNAANIAYKLVQYIAHSRAYGPILQGFNQPINDLSRGATIKDILTIISLTVIQVQEARG